MEKGGGWGGYYLLTFETCTTSLKDVSLIFEKCKYIRHLQKERNCAKKFFTQVMLNYGFQALKKINFFKGGREVEFLFGYDR